MFHNSAAYRAATDGAVNRLGKFLQEENSMPHLISGDFDSADPKILAEFSKLVSRF